MLQRAQVHGLGEIIADIELHPVIEDGHQDGSGFTTLNGSTD
jgi:hypothetical protein